MITQLKSIKFLIKTSVILVGVLNWSSLLMLESKIGKNVIEFDLIFEDKDFSFNELLFVCYQLEENFVVTEAIK